MKTKYFLLSLIVISFVFLIPLTSVAEYGDIVMNQSAAEMRKSKVNDVVFPHWFHRIRFKCKACHESIFVMRAGANKTDMKKMSVGGSCGTCHNDEIAFGTDSCESCHTKIPAPATNVKKTATPKPKN